MIPDPASTVPAPAFDDEFEKTRRTPVQREWAVQRGVRRFVRRAMACEYEFASHDRGAPRSEVEHIKEAERGIRRSWPDVELAYEGGRTFRCELKAPGKKIAEAGEQLRLIQRLNALGHVSIWANSVIGFAEKAAASGVPLLPNWRTVAAHEDALVAADIRKQEVRAEAKKVGSYKPSKPRAPRASRGHVGRVEKIRAGVMF